MSCTSIGDNDDNDAYNAEDAVDKLYYWLPVPLPSKRGIKGAMVSGLGLGLDLPWGARMGVGMKIYKRGVVSALSTSATPSVTP
jgi:hypothetical protein